MAEISAKDVAALRKATGAGMMDCKKALEENDGDPEAAKDWLRTKGLAGAAKRAGREAHDQGAVDVARRRQRRRARRAHLRDRLRRQGRRLPHACRRARRSIVAEQGDEDLAEPAVRGLDRRRAHHPARRQARREHRARSGRALRDRRRPPRRLQAHPERPRHDRRARRARRRRPVRRQGPGGRARPRAAHRSRRAAVRHPRRRPRRRRRRRSASVLEELTRNEGKPEQAIPKIVEGRLNGFYKDYVLLEQGVRAGAEDHGRQAPRGPRRRCHGPPLRPGQDRRGVGRPSRREPTERDDEASGTAGWC